MKSRNSDFSKPRWSLKKMVKIAVKTVNYKFGKGEQATNRKSCNLFFFVENIKSERFRSVSFSRPFDTCLFLTNLHFFYKSLFIRMSLRGSEHPQAEQQLKTYVLLFFFSCELYK